jgi:hypothetical protein
MLFYRRGWPNSWLAPPTLLPLIASFADTSTEVLLHALIARISMLSHQRPMRDADQDCRACLLRFVTGRLLCSYESSRIAVDSRYI